MALLEYRAARARIPQASAPPDPALSFTQYLAAPQTRVGPRLSSVSVTQALPWFGALSDRRELAEVESEILNQSHAERRAEVVRRVKLAYYYLAYLDRALRVTEEEERRD